MSKEYDYFSEETEADLRMHVSNCFNHRGYKHDGETLDESGYQQLSRLMIEEYDLTNSDVDEVVSNIEDMVSKFIMENSPKFYDDDE